MSECLVDPENCSDMLRRYL